jgi:regulator of sirC expression with transglutaminase-like and TPR domain
MTQVLDDSKLKSLIHLLEDDDSQTYDLIYPQIMEMGAPILPLLLEAEDQSLNPILSDRLHTIVHHLNLQKTINDFKDWKQHNARNLYQGLSILSKYQYPRLELRKVSELINKIRQDLWLEVNDNLTALEKVRILNHIFFDVYNFKGDTKDYYALENSFINEVLIRRKGNPLTLSSIYSIVAQSVNIPIYGVNIPRNYMLVYVERLYSQVPETMTTNDVLFYINTFNRGEIHSLNDIQNYLKRIQVEPKVDYYLPCPNELVIERSINNIINAYSQMGESSKIEDYRLLLDALTS